MHDPSIERRLSAALHAEADGLGFTITAAELERRHALRRRSLAGRRLTLLLAAAVGIGLFGVGGALSGLFDQKPPTPTSPAIAVDPTDVEPSRLPTLDELIAAEPAGVILAQAHGPTDAFGGIPETELEYPFISLGALDTVGTYTLTAACLHGATLDFIFPPHVAGGIPRATIPCDGRTHAANIAVSQPQDAAMTTQAGTAWRLVIRGPAQPASAQALGDLPASADQQELVRWDAAPLHSGAQPWASAGLVIQKVGTVPPREGYYARLLCAAGAPVRLVFGDELNGAIVARTESRLACDPQRVREVSLLTAQPDGGQVYLVAEPNQAVSLLVTSPAPPVALTETLPGWRLSGGLGPELAFEAHTMSLRGAGVGEDHIQVVMDCAGTAPIAVRIEDGQESGPRAQTFEAKCTPDGATTRHIFTVAEQGVGVHYVAPKGAWTALSILVPGN